MSVNDPVEPHVESNADPVPHSSGRHLSPDAAIVKVYDPPHPTAAGESSVGDVGPLVVGVGAPDGSPGV